MNEFSINGNTPIAEPVTFEFESKNWYLFPYRTFGVQRCLERYVAQYVIRNIELLRPNDDDADPNTWRMYEDAKKAVQTSIERGLYSAATDGFFDVAIRTNLGLAETMHQCIAWKQPEWTRGHSTRLFNSEIKAHVIKLFEELNFPPAKKNETAN